MKWGKRGVRLRATSTTPLGTHKAIEALNFVRVDHRRTRICLWFIGELEQASKLVMIPEAW